MATCQYADDEKWQPTGDPGMRVSRNSAHKFLRATIHGPSWCDWCKEFMWGFRKHALRCAECKFTIHKRCEASMLDCTDEQRTMCRVSAQSSARQERPTFMFKVKKSGGPDSLLEVDPNSNSIIVISGWGTSDKKRVACTAVLVEKPLRDFRSLDLRLPDGDKGRFQFASRREREEFAAAVAVLAGRVSKPGRPWGFSSAQLRVLMGTWNMGDAPPPEPSSGQRLAEWLHPEAGYDLVVVTVQECEYKPRYGFPTCEEDWFRTVESVLGTRYVRVAGLSMWSIRIVVFVRTELREQISNIQKTQEATGIARVAGNKGGVLISFNLRDTRLCFIGSHLAAHQEKIEARNYDYQEIIQGCSNSVGWKDFEITNEFHYVFWAGDLNYRIAHPRAEVVRLSESGPTGWNALYAYDQLRTELRKEAAFVEWCESQPLFKPTYRYLRGEDQYSEEKQRIPSWCDRVLWKGLSEEPIEQEDYNSVQTVLSSDHRPVYSVFKLMLRNQYIPRSVVHPLFGVGSDLPPEAEVHFRVTNLAGHDLLPSDANGLSDPYVVFQGPVLQNAYQTKVLTKTLDPRWEDGHIPPLFVVFDDDEFIRNEYIWFCAYDWDMTTQDDALGQAHLSLKHVSDGRPHQFCLRILSAGRVAGTLTGNIQMFKAPRRAVAASAE
eukprot:Hpha_TRINITY_DN15985_c1_g1::TRINITY_DN15985_c1_g1_i1::g.72520::m.72520/K15909/SHIP2, INPPL1; phosphatidylinositol-3,4,5-trisphosphate 5-phosphatase 2